MLLSRSNQDGTALAAARSATFILLVGLLLGAMLVCAAPAQAGGSVRSLLDDASDGVVDGTYSISTVRAALQIVRGDPSYMQYSDIEGVLADYLASLTRTPSPHPTRTAKPTQTAAPTTTPTTTAKPASQSEKKDRTATPRPKPSSDAVAPTAAPSPSASADAPLVSSWSQAGARLAAAPWFFAAGATMLAVGIVLLRRRRST